MDHGSSIQRTTIASKPSIPSRLPLGSPWSWTVSDDLRVQHGVLCCSGTVVVCAGVPNTSQATGKVATGDRPGGVIASLNPFGASHMNNIIYIVGLIVVVLVILSFFGLR